MAAPGADAGSPQDAGPPHDGQDAGPPPASTACRPGVASCSPPKDYMIIPMVADQKPEKEDDQWYWALSQWTKNWKKADPKNREYVEIPPETTYFALRASSADAYRKVVPLAKGRMIIHALGHGAATSDTTYKYNSTFDFGSQLGSFTKHELKFQNDMFLLHDKDTAGKFRYSANNKKEEVLYERLRDLYSLAEEIGNVMKTGPTPSELRILTCSLGQDTTFLGRLAGVLKVKIGAYTEFVDIDYTTSPFRMGFFKLDSAGDKQEERISDRGKTKRRRALQDGWSSSELPTDKLVWAP